MESSRSLKTPSLVLVLSVLVFSLAAGNSDSCETKILNLRTNNAVEPLASRRKSCLQLADEF